MMVPTKIEPMLRTKLLSWPAKARMGIDFLMPALPPNGDESLGAFVTRRLGRPVYERLIEPLMSGIYAGDGDQLSLQSTFPTLRELELKYGGLVKGALAMRKKMSGNGSRAGVSRSVFLTPKSGLVEIVEKLVEQLQAWGVPLRAGQAAQHIAWENQQYQVRLESGEILAADALILATPAYTTGDLLAGMDKDLAADLQAIPYVSTATISLAYRTQDLPRPLDGYGYVIPRREGRRALACTWTSTKFPHRAPEGFSLLRVFAGRAGMQDDLPTDQAGLIQLAREELLQTLEITALPLFAKVFFWENAMPQYNLGHPARLEQIEAATARLPGLFLAGNGYRGIGIPDCIHSGEIAAGKVLGLS
jgi:oxygen-dependent protoporphyrinogen oxidase